MKLYDEGNKFCHDDLVTSLSNNMTITFLLQFKSCMERDYVLIDKEGEFLVKLSKKNKIYFYVGEKCGKMSIQLKSEDLESGKLLKITIVRNVDCKKISIFVNNKLNSTNCIDDNNLEIYKACSEIKYYYGGSCEEYEMSHVRIYNDAFNFNQLNEFDCCDKKQLFEKIYCDMYETYRFEDNIYYYIMTPDGIIYFPDESKTYESLVPPVSPPTKNKYPEFAFRYYNIEQNERNLCIDGIVCAKYENLHNLFNVERFVTNIVTWQFQDRTCEFQQAHPKYIQDGKVGYWSQLQGLTPFTPYLNSESLPPNPNPLAKYPGNLKNGFVISFIKLLVNQYLANGSDIYKISIEKLVDYLIALASDSSNNTRGIPDAYPSPTLNTSPNDNLVSLQQGNYLNYLKVLDIIINHEQAKSIIDSVRLEKLKKKYEEILNLLLKLQVECGGRITIWAEFYTSNATTGADHSPNLVVKNSQPSNPVISSMTSLLTVPESVEILRYLMNIKCPSTEVKKAIKNGVMWLSLNKLEGYAQYFDDASGKMVIEDISYTNGPKQDILHTHYYSIPGISLSPTPIEPCGPMFYNTSSIYHGTSISDFNEQTFDQQVDQFGTWARCAIDLYEQWKQIYDLQCKQNTISCKKCNHQRCKC
jgi:PelA/Pel-15E family pectate lyase